MNLSIRLKAIVDLIDEKASVADIGTDHGYIPIYLMENKLASKVIASDINKGPIDIAIKNLKEHNITLGVETRLGPGLKTLSKGEVDVAIIAGMGGNLIASILEDSIDIAKEFNYIILQPAQHQEVLRKYLYESGFKIITEKVVFDSDKYYHTMKVTKGNDTQYENEVHYYTGRGELNTRSNDFKGYINEKIKSMEKIIKYTAKSEDKSRYEYLSNLIKEFKEVKREYDL
ncbi:tRNA (adenine(22)-N(1))-methyltransferase [Clostridium cylindrosporum]|uniref:tRNA (Adenine(22)-N(1))-methyltransferase TrmK n=1 Tax=Clostridium cylindrosporum DSM 605 TaxID=1121307 RepID=A0A0J8D710_CLOCY|nr:class I SAM-dependent methyltransferase [Clostridium cylindrosporum]KMT21667.1 tRNA (adenine(22)-N(1))-methyltransferase TrmK [Clostridium cylindrosporum DSM 605]